MTDFLLKLFGVQTRDASHVTDRSLSFHGVNPVYVMLAGLALAGLVYWMYRRTAEHISAARRWTLTVLRALFLVLILGLLLRPVLTIAFEHTVRRSLLLVFDTSSSMSEIKDQRSEEDDLKRVAIARNLIDPSKGLNQPMPAAGLGGATMPARIDLLKASLKNEKMDLLSRLAKDYDLAAFTFDKGLAEIPGAAYRISLEQSEEAKPAEQEAALNTRWVEKLEAKGPFSAVGDAVREVISRKRGQPLAGILLVTDGASNSGVQPLDAATLAGKDHVPLYIYGVGITSPKDIIVGSIFAQEVAFAKDEVPVSVRVRSMGLAGQSAKLVVQLGAERAEREVQFNADGEQVVTVNVTPQRPGEFDIKASIEPRADEVVKDNNSATQHIRVIDGKIKVLFIEQYPRWEFKYAQAILMRDRRIDLKCVLLEGDPSIVYGEGSPFLSEFPRKKEDLFKYDLLVIGDVDPRTFTPAATEMIAEFVSKFGGAMAMVAGKRFAPAAYRGTRIEKMLPVELESLDIGNTAPANRPIKLELTPAGKASQMLRISDKELESASRWAQMPAVYWAAKVARAKPAAEVLVVDPDPSKGSRYGKMPVMAVHQYGLGQVLFLGTDNLWRWRRNAGDRYHTMIWGQLTQRMALPHLLGASKRTHLTADQKKYTTGQRVTIYARLYTEGFEPMLDATVKAHYSEQGSQALPREAMLRPIPGQPGMYRGELVAPSPAVYEFGVDHDRATKLEFAVEDPRQELNETAMNKTLLEQMAAASGGAFFREEDLNSLPDKITGKMERIRTKQEVEIWSTPAYFIALLMLVTVEWVMRKMSQLK
jgi:uncharacterized membrane protein